MTARCPPLPADDSVLASLLVAVAALAALSLLATGLVGSAGAAPPPEELCGVCGDDLESAAADAGVPLTVEHSTATIRIGEDGSGHWRARVRVSGPAADRLAANATLRHHVVRETYEHGRTFVDDPRDLRTRVENDTLVVSFDVPDVAHRSVGGVVLVDMLDWRTRRAGLRVAADELTISGPNGTAVTRAPSSVTVDDGSVVIRSAGPNAGLWGDTRLAFAPTDGPVARGLTTVGFVAFGVALADEGVFFLGVVPALLLGGTLFALRRWGETVPSVDPSLLTRGVAGGGAVVAAVAALSLAGLGFLAPAVAETVLVFTTLYALVGACPLVVDRPSPRVALGWTLCVAAAVAAVASTVSIGALQTALLSVPAVLWFPLGRARGRDGGVSGFVAAATAVAPFGAAVLYQPTASPLFGLLVSLLTTIPWAGGTALFGFPLYLLGRDIGGPAEAADQGGHTNRVGVD